MIAKLERTWQDVSAEQCAILRSGIPKAWVLQDPPPASRLNVMNVPYETSIMTPRELELTEKDATELLGMLANGSLKSYDLTLAFCKRAAIAQQLINCLTQIWFEEGLQRAKELDEYYEKHKKVVGPYHGLPFSIKNQFRVKGKELSSGFMAWLGPLCEEDASPVKYLREFGAVFYCQTNAPQTLMHLETVNNITGRTLNPYNRDLSAGGSSGGESALVAFRGSPIGLAADGGGSIRNPAANVGLVGMKCTSQRVPQAGSKAPMFGNECTPVSVGPICRSARDNTYFFQVMLATEPWLREPYLVPVPWRLTEKKPKIRIGVVTDDGIVRPHPPVLAGIKALCAKLSAHPDFEIFPWTPYEHSRGYEIVRRIYFCDGGAQNRAVIASAGEPVCELSEWIMKPDVVVRHDIESLWRAQAERNKYRQDYLTHWNNHPDAPDLLLMPVGFGVATRHDTAKYWGYTAIYNLLDYPACAFPTGMSVDPSNPEHAIDSSYVPRDNEFEKYTWDLYNQFGPEGYKDAPIALQLVGRKYDCERVMETVSRIEEIVSAK